MPRPTGALGATDVVAYRSRAQIVMRYLIGLGDELDPLRYRLLPTSQFINIEYYGVRQRHGMDVSSTIAVHCGYLKNNADKLEHLELHGFLQRGLSHHRRVYLAVVALGEVGHGEMTGEPRLYGASDTPLRYVLPRKNHTKFAISLRR